MASITNEVLAEKIDGLGIRFGALEKKVDAMPSAFVSHEVLELKLGTLESRLAEQEKKRTALTWGVPVVTAVIGSVITFLVIQQLGGK